MVKLIFASLSLLICIAIIGLPLLIVWVGITAELSFWGHMGVTALGLFLCYLVKPVSVFTGKDYKLF